MYLHYVFTFSGTKSTVDVGINTSLDIVSYKKSEVVDKNTMTDEFCHLKDDPYSLSCTRYTTHMYPPSIQQISQAMNRCPFLNESIFVPRAISPLSPVSGK